MATINVAMIALIAKKDGVVSLGDYWPISLIHSIAKFLSLKLARVNDS